ncbi:hypothetical protein ACQCP0_24930 [Ralstonia pseudosolanacearum]|uniref:ORC-CDC6 family AAA ATPase n=2 Tax=Ralstonia pseudosolanacearum TaxID=1310165 RepID=UPI003CED0FD2
MSGDQSNIFEERAENLSKEELSDWTMLTNKDSLNLRKLKGPGAKLLIGPRGCGKSTLMRIAYFQLLSERAAFPVYVNYSRSMALEPLFHSHSNATLIFRQWVLCKIAKEAKAAADEIGLDLPRNLARIAIQAEKLIIGLERGEVSDDSDLLLSPSELAAWLEEICNAQGVSRAVLLLDDAAHAFSGEQQAEFFEIFRQLRTKSIAPKAAVYPGITSYSPNFHIGHEAEELSAWYDAGDPQYIDNMKSLIYRRFSDEMRGKLEGKEEQIELLALVAFGIPRGFLNMLSALVDQNSAKAGWSGVKPIIEAHAASVRKIFKSLSVRLPKFTHFVEVGIDLERAFIDQLRRFNMNHVTPGAKTTIVGIEEPISPNLERVLHMLEYSGVVRDVGSQSRGKGSYRRYMFHHALVATDNALSLGRSFSLRTVCDGLSAGGSQSLVRAKASTLLGSDYEGRCKLSFSQCPKCGTQRAFSDQRYCMKCGTELRDGSIYAEVLRLSLTELPLPERKLEDIISHTNLRTINDILADDRQKLRTIPYVGPVWAKRIYDAAEEFVSM